MTSRRLEKGEGIRACSLCGGPYDSGPYDAEEKRVIFVEGWDREFTVCYECSRRYKHHQWDEDFWDEAFRTRWLLRILHKQIEDSAHVPEWFQEEVEKRLNEFQEHIGELERKLSNLDRP